MPAGSSPSGVPDGADASRLAARELGSAVAAARESSGLRVEQVAEATRIRATLVRAIESGDFAPCGGHVYARGHLRAIATALGTDAAAFLDAYDKLSGQTDTVLRTASDEDRVEAEPMALAGLRGQRHRPASGWLIAAVAAAAVLAVGIGFSVVRGGTAPSDHRAAPTVSRSAQQPQPQPSEPSRPAASQTVAYAGVNVTVNVHDGNSWVHATDETGAVVFQGTLAAGQTKDFHAAERLKFVFGYAPAVNLVVNGKSIGQPPANSSEVATVSIDSNTATTGQLG